MERGTRQTGTAYNTSNGGVCMEGNNITQQVEVTHTVPKMTDTERTIAEKRVSSDLYEILSDIYAKLKLESE